MTGTKTGEANKTYASLLSYAPQGAVASLSLGNGLSETTNFNNRLQPTSISLGALASFGYAYGATNNNGNVLSQAITAPGFSVTQNYSYDALSRLTGVNESGLWSQSYGYDQYGNRISVTSPTYLTTFAPAPAINASNNRISDVSFAYDSAGNLTQAPVAPSGALQSFTYDAENKLVNFNNSAATYSYDGDGRRVKKIVGTTTSIFVYNAQGQVVAEYTTPAPVATGGTSYLMADHLGSTRVVTNASGTVSARHDYLPFGEEIASGIGGRTTGMGYGANEGLRQKFTAKERDSESGLDYFGARHYGSSMGRFASPDLINVTRRRLVNPANTLNKYVYAGNNLLLYVDPDGQDITIFYRQSGFGLFDWGHIFIAAINQQTGGAAFLDFYPVGSRSEINPNMTADRLRAHAALTIQTTPEVAQRVIDLINKLKANTPDYDARNNNCTTICEEALAAAGIPLPDSFLPDDLWNALYAQYSTEAISARQQLNNPFFTPIFSRYQTGVDFGRPSFLPAGSRFSIFDLLSLVIQSQKAEQVQPKKKACVTIQGPKGPETSCEEY